MQKNTNTSPDDKNAVSLDNILNEYDNTPKEADTKENFDDAMKKLDAMFESEAEDLAWLDDIMSEKSSSSVKKKVEEPEPEISEAEVAAEEIQDTEPEAYETEETIVAENADAPANSFFSAPEELPPLEDRPEIEEVVEEDSIENTQDTFEPEEAYDDTKVFTAGTVEYELPQDAPEEIGLDDFEGNTPVGEYVHNVESAAKQQASNVNSSLGKLFGLEDDILDEQSKGSKRKNNTHKKIAKALGAYEEINMADPDAVGEGQRHYYLKKCRALLALFGATFFLMIGLYLDFSFLSTDAFSLPLPAILKNNPLMLSLVNLQILCFGAMCLLDSLANGFFAILDRKFSPASCALAVVFACAAHSVTSAVMITRGVGKITMFCSVGVFALFMLALYDFLKASADDKAYRIASSTSNKYGAYQLGVNSLECSPFASHIDLEKAKVISVSKGSVYEGFVGRNEKAPEDENKLGIMTAIIFAVALVTGLLAIFSDFPTPAEKVYYCITSFILVFISSVPFSMFFVSALPKFLATKLGKNINATLVGQNASEEYKGLSVVAFEDTEVFLPKDVRISSIKTYGGMALDEAVVTMSKIYGKIGGPLSKIFAKMVDIRNLYTDVRLVKVYPDAIEVNVDGVDVCLATASYLGANGIRIINDSVDASYEQSHGSILFMVCGGRILAKFYIKYSINPTFEKTLKDLHDANLCVGIKTLDPCITNDLVFGCLEKANYALSVIKGSNANDIPVVKNRVSSGVIALGSVHNFLEMLLVCERTGRNVKINRVIRLISTILCVGLSAFLAINNTALTVAIPLLIQAFWLLPVTAVSFFNK